MVGLGLGLHRYCSLPQNLGKSVLMRYVRVRVRVSEGSSDEFDASESLRRRSISNLNCNFEIGWRRSATKVGTRRIHLEFLSIF